MPEEFTDVVGRIYENFLIRDLTYVFGGALLLAAQLWKPKKRPQPFDYPPNPKIPKTKSNPQPLSSDPSKHAQFRTYPTL
jgi:hypothetical protein